MRLGIKRMRTRIDGDTGNIEITSLGCSVHISTQHWVNEEGLGWLLWKPWRYRGFIF